MHPAATDGIAYAGQAAPAAALAALPEPLAHWFAGRFGEPTAAQCLAWPALAEGHHLLLSAPTGTGKTLAALLPVLGRMLFGPPDPDRPRGVRCVYVAPLKALVNDACRGLQAHLDDLAASLSGVAVPRLAVRSGDSSARDRRRLRTDPPDVLFTTPESLAVLLSQPAHQGLFAPLRWAVVDEVHALAPTKRGADLALSLERLADLAAGPVQRVGLSATAAPLEVAARYVAGAGRPCVVARAGEAAPLELTFVPLDGGPGFVAQLVERLEPEVRAHRSTLVFTNARGLAERLAWALRRRMPDLDDAVAVHHSALAAERRRDVEQRFKEGQLRAVVSSTSLELGIDIGTVDLAVLVHPPGDVVRLLQRVGRAGHGPGRVKRGLVLTASAAELLEAAVTGASGQSAQCEPLRLPDAPLDVLCQQILGMAAARPWSPDDAYALARRATPYADLARADFDDCVAYLRGLDPGGGPWLPPRLADDRGVLTILDDRTARLLLRNLGTILAEEATPVVVELQDAGPPTDYHAAGVAPSPLAGKGGGGGDAARGRFAPPPSPPEGGRGQTKNGRRRLRPHDPRRTYHDTRHTNRETRRTIGQVDEAFAERLQPGDRFLLDGRCLEVRRLEGGELLVEEVGGRPAVPRWAGEGWPLSTELARRLYVLRVRAAEALRDGPDALAELLRRDYALGGAAAAALADYFERQETLSEIPDAGGCLVEAVGGEEAVELYVHTPLNRTANDALARVAALRLARDGGRASTAVVGDLGFALFIPRGLGPEASVPGVLRDLLAPGGFPADLDAALADSAALRERFRRAALTGLMLLRNPLGMRRRVGGRDWAERQLFDQVRAHAPDFVLLRQAGREVRAEVCDAKAALRFAEALPGMAVRCRWLPQPSPFAEAWTQSGAGAAEEVETAAEALQRLHAVLTGQGSAT